MPRRTRTAQPGSRRGWKIAATTAATLVVALLIAFAGFKTWLNRYLRSPEFCTKLETNLSNDLRAKADVSPIRFDSAQFYCDGLKATGAEDAAFSDIQVDNVRGEFSYPSLWRILFGDRHFQVDRVEVQRLAANFYNTRTGLTLPPKELRKHRLDVTAISVRELRLGWTAGGLTGTAVEFTPVEGGWKASGQGGHLTQLGLPGMELASARFVFKEPTLFVQEARLQQDGGEFAVSGEATRNDKADLLFTLAKINITPYLPDDWRARLHGRLAGEARLLYPLTDNANATPSVRGHLELHSAQLEALPILAKLADFTKTDQFRRLPLDQLRTDFRYENHVLTFTNFILETKQLIKVTGRLTRTGDQLDGTFEIGITPGPLQYIPGSQEKVFTTLRDGYAWAPLRLTGTTDAPREDLTARLATAAGQAIVESLENTATKAAGGAVDAAKKGATSVFDLLFGR